LTFVQFILQLKLYTIVHILLEDFKISLESINQYRKCLHRDVASTVQIITVHKIQKGKQLLKIKKVVTDCKQQKTNVIHFLKVSRLGAQ